MPAPVGDSVKGATICEMGRGERMWLRATAKAGSMATIRLITGICAEVSEEASLRRLVPKIRASSSRFVVQEQPEGVADVEPEATASNQQLGEHRGPPISEHQGALLEQAEPGAIDAGAHRKAHYVLQRYVINIS